MSTRSDQLQDGRYFQGGTTESYSDSIKWWESFNFQQDSSDITIVITPQYHHAPWRMAHDLYQKSWLGWFILQYNDVINELDEFVTGATIVVPTPKRLSQELLIRTNISIINSNNSMK